MEGEFKKYYNLPYNKDFWAWVSPDNHVIMVPKLGHKGYIMRQYKDADFGWDYDRVFDQAVKDGWVRVIYEYFPHSFSASLSLNGYDEERVNQLLIKNCTKCCKIVKKYISLCNF